MSLLSSSWFGHKHQHGTRIFPSPAKIFLFERKVQKRVDRCLLSLMKFNKGFDFIIKKSRKVKKKRSNRLVIIRQRHLSNLSLSMDWVNESNDKTWFVTSLSNSENFYKVSLLGECENII